MDWVKVRAGEQMNARCLRGCRKVCGNSDPDRSCVEVTKTELRSIRAFVLREFFKPLVH